MLKTGAPLDMAHIEVRLQELVRAKAAREGADKIPYETIAKDTGISYATVASYMKGQVERPHLGVLAKFCKWLDCEIGDLLVYVED